MLTTNNFVSGPMRDRLIDQLIIAAVFAALGLGILFLERERLRKHFGAVLFHIGFVWGVGTLAVVFNLTFPEGGHEPSPLPLRSSRPVVDTGIPLPPTADDRTRCAPVYVALFIDRSSSMDKVDFSPRIDEAAPLVSAVQNCGGEVRVHLIAGGKLRPVSFTAHDKPQPHDTSALQVDGTVARRRRAAAELLRRDSVDWMAWRDMTIAGTRASWRKLEDLLTRVLGRQDREQSPICHAVEQAESFFSLTRVERSRRRWAIFVTDGQSSPRRARPCAAPVAQAAYMLVDGGRRQPHDLRNVAFSRFPGSLLDAAAEVCDEANAGC